MLKFGPRDVQLGGGTRERRAFCSRINRRFFGGPEEKKNIAWGNQRKKSIAGAKVVMWLEKRQLKYPGM